MRRRTALLLLLGVAGLLAVGLGLSFRLLGAAVQAVRSVTEDRLRAVGVTAAHALALHQDGALLRAVCRDNGLEGAYLLDGSLRPVLEGPDAGPGAVLSLLRFDPEAALRALRGVSSVGDGYRLEAIEPGASIEPGTADAAGRRHTEEVRAGEVVLAGYFPVPSATGTRVLVLEAGPAFTSPQQRLQRAAFGAGAVAAALGTLCALLVMTSVRAAQRERLLYGRAERGQAISQMAAMVAHEIRNPLGTIRAAAELCREQTREREVISGGAPQEPGLLDDILEEVERLNGLCTEFLTLSRDPPLQVSEFDLSALCDEVCQAVRLRAGEAPLVVRRDGEPALVMRGDRDRLRQVLLNLSLNAVQAMPAGGELRVRVGRTGLGHPVGRLIGAATGGAEVLVQDTGPGIDQGTSRRLFEPFATTKAGGTGLGLVLSRRIAERHGGTLTLRPSAPAGPRRGACFRLRLPLRPPDLAGDRPPPSTPTSLMGTPT